MTSASVKALFTSGLPNCVRSEYGVLKWIWFVFSVRQVNQMLSTSVTVRPSRLRKTSPTVEVLVEPPPPILRVVRSGAGEPPPPLLSPPSS